MSSNNIVPSTTSSIISIVIMVVVIFLLVWFAIWYFKRSTGIRDAYIEQTRELTNPVSKNTPQYKNNYNKKISKFYNLNIK